MPCRHPFGPGYYYHQRQMQRIGHGQEVELQCPTLRPLPVPSGQVSWGGGVTTTGRASAGCCCWWCRGSCFGNPGACPPQAAGVLRCCGNHVEWRMAGFGKTWGGHELPEDILRLQKDIKQWHQTDAEHL